MEEKSSKLVQEFVGLAGLEAGDVAAESIFHDTLSSVQKYMEAARLRTQTETKIKRLAEAAIVKKNGTYAAYAEAMRLQMQEEEHEQNAAFAKAAAGMTDEALIQWDAGLDLIWTELFRDPKDFLRALTVGYMQLIDEAWLADNAREGETAKPLASVSTSPAYGPASSWCSRGSQSDAGRIRTSGSPAESRCAGNMSTMSARALFGMPNCVTSR